MSVEHYAERLRPQYHFSMKKGWINDPNGLVHYDGTYHMFCQHYPDDIKWGPMHWSHATSPDMVNWTEQPIALYPDELGTCFSGSAVVDWKNTSGLGVDGKPPLLAFYTAAGGCVTPKKPSTQCLAYSNDNGQSWRKYDANPVLDHVIGANRDPKVFWYEPGGHWIMVLYLDGATFGLFASLNAIDWTELSRFDVEGNCECPDLFEMPVTGRDGHSKWVFLSGAGAWSQGDLARYVIGSFDGTTFTPESDAIPIELGGWNYSTQTYSNAPDGRRIFVGWFSTQFDGANALPETPFNGQYRVPWELSLVETDAGLRIAKQPVEELKALREGALRLAAGEYRPGSHPVEALTSRSLDIEFVIRPQGAESVGVVAEGVELVRYDSGSQTMRVLDRENGWPVGLDGLLALRILFDVNCVEVFGPDGLKVMSSVYLPDTLTKLDETRPSLSLEVKGSSIFLDSMTVWPMRSIWMGNLQS
jgi:fructan beta-fructosidase